MSDEQERSIKDVEKDQAELEDRAKALEKAIEKAEAKHPGPLDHAADGGVI